MTKTKKPEPTEAELKIQEAIQEAQAAAKHLAEDSQEALMGVLDQIRDGFTKASEAVIASNERLSENHRKVLLAILDNAKSNANSDFDTIKKVLTAESLEESVNIQRDALRASVERGVNQVREVSEMAMEGGKKGLEPVNELLTKLRDGKLAG